MGSDKPFESNASLTEFPFFPGVQSYVYGGAWSWRELQSGGRGSQRDPTYKLLTTRGNFLGEVAVTSSVASL